MRIPGVASAWDGIRNVGSSLNYGWDLPKNIGSAMGGDFSGLSSGATHIGSVGGLLTAGGAIGVGAIAGGIAGSMGEVDMTMQGIAIGAAAGAVALPAAGLAAKGAYKLGEATVKGAWNLASNPNTYKTAAAVGGPIVNTAAMAVGAPAARMAKGFMGLGSKMVRFDAEAKLLDKVKFTGLGKSVIGGSAAIVGVAGAFNELNKSRMGQMDGQITRATPNVTPTFNNGGYGGAYANNAGATGDLVFALNANRRG